IHASGRSLQGWQVLHLAGKDNADEVKAEYRELEMPAVVLDFTPAMSDVWAVADLAVARAGASTCAELAVCGVPSVLMPYPFHKDQHQLANAKVLADAGASVVVSDERDRKKSGDALTPIIEGLLYDVPQRKAMSDAAFTLAKPDAAERVANVLREMMAGQ
ncbi:MAG TPA: UDP-N-acetylglucosamine--N-acetylmuramyl-(pentapeptide) pyrophosphoryl-undecaprenol N-acetylglucosamine transferase, partial [Tepidisphaeraceae bacterium]|nr:UDP-N-acetylglucosamine--N-acetylmuramyl-(pentapeptide) pyrophosphoryl-undecaprenol N-acetylglucosamine transferase [Tepidisphaeraceae bacterium]